MKHWHFHHYKILGIKQDERLDVLLQQRWRHRFFLSEILDPAGFMFPSAGYVSSLFALSGGSPMKGITTFLTWLDKSTSRHDMKKSYAYLQYVYNSSQNHHTQSHQRSLTPWLIEFSGITRSNQKFSITVFRFYTDSIIMYHTKDLVVVLS